MLRDSPDEEIKITRDRSVLGPSRSENDFKNSA
jgi:hypothetical protein